MPKADEAGSRESSPTRKTLFAGCALFAANALALVAMLHRPDDLTYANDLHSPLDFQRVFALLERIPRQLFLSHPLASSFLNVAVTAGVIAGAVVLLTWFGYAGVASDFFLAAGGVFAVACVYYSGWHEGLFFFVLIYAAVLAYERRGGARTRLDVAATIVLIILAARHIEWSASSIRYDAKRAYTGSAAAARFIRTNGIEHKTVAGMGVRSIELQPYFPRNLFFNYDFGGKSFWNWSTTNTWPYPSGTDYSPMRMLNFYEPVLAAEPEYVVAAIGFRNDHQYAAALHRNRSYELIGTFAGRTFWKDAPEELIAFQLFHRRAAESH